MTEFVSRPGSSRSSRTAVSGGRPVPIGDDHHGRPRTTVPTDELPDWPARFAALTEAARQRRERTAELRRQLAEARTAGKAARHRARLARVSSTELSTVEEP